jgi:hypothetical protein
MKASAAPSLHPRGWAVLYALASALGLVVLLIVAPRPAAPEEPAACRAQVAEPGAALACLDGLRPSILTAELAGTPARWACQLQRREPVHTMSLPQAACAEMRGLRLREEIVGFDNGFFIPLYAVLSLLVVGWAAACVREAGKAATAVTTLTTGKTQIAGGRRFAMAALVLALATGALVALDKRENRHAVQMLDMLAAAGAVAAGGQGAPAAQGLAADQAGVARRVSLDKWASTALWAAALAWAYALTLRPGAARHAGGWWRLAWIVPPSAMGFAALAFAAGTAMGLAGEGLRGPVGAIGAGMATALGGMLSAAVAAALLAWRKMPPAADAAQR